MERDVHFVLFCLIFFVMAAVSACAHIPPSSALVLAKSEPAPVHAPAPVEEQPRVPDEYLVKLAPDVDKDVIFGYFGNLGIKDLFAIGGETFLLVLINDPGPQKMEALIYEDSRVMAVQPNLIYWDNRSGRITK